MKEWKELLHGCDYNPDQWLNRPDILEVDVKLMKKAGINVVSVGIFSWAEYEPEEGVYTFEWMDRIMDTMYENGIHVILATPSGAKPPWLVRKYPEVMRTRADRVQLLYGDRENQCNSNKIYREKVRILNEKLAQRYAQHPALIMWHLSNEMYGSCHCETCQEKFREWLKEKYKTIERLNEQYWSSFWSHKYSAWEEIESPSPIGEAAMHALDLDYKRFYSDLSIDFLKMEAEAIRKYSKDIPITSNMFHHNCGINYYDLGKVLDVISWDSYPRWHCGKDKTTEWENAVGAAFDFDFCRALQNKPFYLMESVPSVPSQFEACKLKRPGMHLLGAVQALACGSDSVQYFQWRKSRGGYEKFHGAVVGHNGSADTRVFRDVAEVGEKLKALSHLKGAQTEAKVAIIFDWDNLRALETQISLKRKKEFAKIVMEYYDALLKNYVSVDVINQKADFSKYQMIVAPTLYLFQPETYNKIRSFVADGGSFVLSFYSGLVNENDLAFECFPPYSLNDVFGIRCEETDSLCPDEYNVITYNKKEYQAVDLCDLIHVEDAEVLSIYEKDFYRGRPSVTRKGYGKGKAYYIAFRSQDDFLKDFMEQLVEEAKIKRIVDAQYVEDVMVKEREINGKKYIFVMNFSSHERSIRINEQNYMLEGYSYRILEE